jgi:hypothetical protein
MSPANLLNLSAAVVGFSAAGAWWRSASIRVGAPMNTYGGWSPTDPFWERSRKSGWWNTAAAVLSGLTSALWALSAALALTGV